MTKQILISFCNNPARSASQILCVNIPSTWREGFLCAPVTLGQPLSCVHATGLTKTQDSIFVAYISELGKQCIACLKKENLSVLFSQELPEVKDCHSILAFNNSIYLISTGTDEVIKYDLRTDSLRNPRIIWRASELKKDTHHVNSIVEHGGNVLISAMGKKSSQAWSSALTGYIHDITRDVRILEGIIHPHSLSTRNGKIYYCNSLDNTFCSMEKGALFALNGYTRGVDWLSDNLVCVATSIGRKISKSTGVVTDPFTHDEPAGECMMIVGDVSSREVVAQTPLSWFGPEVYDLLAFSSSVNPVDASTSAYLAERQVVQNQFFQIQALVSQIGAKDIRLQALTDEVAEKTRKIQELANHVQEKDLAAGEITNPVNDKNEGLPILQSQVSERFKIVHSQPKQLSGEEERLRALNSKIAELEDRLRAADEQLHGILNSRAWKAAVLLRNFRAILLPDGSLRIRIFTKLATVFPFSFLHRRDNISKQDMDLIRQSGMFNRKWYLAHNPDVARSGMEPLRHFIILGGKEGRDPSSEFSSQYYLSSYEDVRKSGMNPLLHYLNFGIHEGRRPNRNFVDVSEES